MSDVDRGECPRPTPPSAPRRWRRCTRTRAATTRTNAAASCSAPRGRRAADRAVACVNTQNDLHAQDPAAHPRDARTAYNLGAGDLFKLGKSLRGDTPAKIIYHSHVDVGAYFSDTDQAAAVMDGEPSYPVEYVVIDVRKDGVGGAAQFAWDPDQHRYVEVGRYPAG